MARRRQGDRALEQLDLARSVLRRHPMFASLLGAVHVVRHEGDPPFAPASPGPEGLVVTDTRGVLRVHPTRLVEPDRWVRALAHGLLHLGFGHGGTDRHGPAATTWPAGEAAVACLAVESFLDALKLGTAPGGRIAPPPLTEARALVEQWQREGVPASYGALGSNGPLPDLVIDAEWLQRQLHPPTEEQLARQPWHVRTSWTDLFASGVTEAVTAAVDVAGGERESLGSGRPPRHPWERALRWFTGHYPLLGALATGMTLVADAALARSWGISLAAVSAESGEIYVNPQAGLTGDEWRFVLAHEMLHAALRHGARSGGRDPYLFNVACDYVINDWLVEMGVGTMPDGSLHDPRLSGLSAESVYDQLTRDLRRARKLRTLRGAAAEGGDVLDRPLPRPGEAIGAVDLDEFYRRALSTGLAAHDAARRGLLPAGLVEEIRALDVPAPAWDARLAHWFEEFVPAAEPQRSYARPSRRQGATPDIPRPGRVRPERLERQPTFGVVLDTSGSMDRRLLGMALGAVAAYARGRGVPRARVVFCDAAAYDAGYLDVDEIAGRVRVRGRGGTVLQPGVDLLERAEDFPPDGPVLLVTDGRCDVVRVRREHAWLVPAGRTLPFRPAGPVFALR